MPRPDARAGPLTGLTVAITADRKGPDLQASLQRLGAEVVFGSTMRALAPESDELLAGETSAMLAARPSWFAVSTGSGLRAWLAAADLAGDGAEVRELLAGANVVARGAKGHGALRAIGVTPVFVSAKETMDDLCSWLADHMRPTDVLGAQVHGGEVIGTLDTLRLRTGGVLTVAPYRWVLPADPAAAEAVVERIVAGDVDILAQTSAPSCRNLFAIAETMQRRSQLIQALRGEICIAAVGSVTARAFEEVGISVDVMPQRPRTGDLLRALSSWAGQRDIHTVEPDPADDGIELVPTANVVRIGPNVIRLGRQEFAVLAAMVRRPHVVMKPADLALQAWGHRMPDDVRLIRHEISRIRRKLGNDADRVETVRNVGYRYRPSRPDDSP